MSIWLNILSWGKLIYRFIMVFAPNVLRALSLRIEQLRNICNLLFRVSLKAQTQLMIVELTAFVAWFACCLLAAAMLIQQLARDGTVGVLSA